MSETNRNPLIRVHTHTRRRLKILAVYYGQTMQDLVERLAYAEMQRLESEGKLNVSGEKSEHWQDGPAR